MNSGGEPERDDTGLPPVDIEIPDDARELDRDVQAYYRERRAERRRLRHHRLRSRITRDGIVLPLLACCLILALITGTLLTVFTATSDQSPTGLAGGAGTSRPPAASSSPSTSPASSPGSKGGSAGASAPNPLVVQTGLPLPAGTLSLATGVQVPLQSLTPDGTMLVLVPSACGCGAALNWLTGIAARQGVRTYLVGTSQTIGEVNHLHSELPASLRGVAPVALDSQGVLAHAYPVKGLTAVIVAKHSTAGQPAAYVQNLSAADNPTPLIGALTG